MTTRTAAEPVTFREPSYALFDPAENGVLTTALGNLAIFSTEGVARNMAATSNRNLQIVKVWITRAGQSNG